MKAFSELLAFEAAVTSVLSAATAGADKDAARVTHLPNFDNEVAFEQYAEQLPLETGEKLFYWYTEAQEDPETAPIVLWLNGGPGCSSMGGFWTENGPFLVDDDLSIKVNRFGWNRKVNLVWLDAPSGVGFSRDVQDEAYYNDDNVAAKTHAFLKLFFDKYSELKGRDFYITGESYAGMYIPFLVDSLVETPIPDVNLKGFAVGNPLTDLPIDANAFLDYYYSHALVSLESYTKAREQCAGDFSCFFFFNVPGSTCSAECLATLSAAAEAVKLDRLNPYNIYGDLCLLNNNQGNALLIEEARTHATPTTHDGVGVCADVLTERYLNLPELQNAIHIENAPVTWVDCNEDINANFAVSYSALPKYRNILDRGLDVLIYSGDADGVVNFIGTERWIGSQGLNLSVTDAWKAWFGPDQQLAGYVQQYDGLTFKTVKGAGHMVPKARPLHALQMIECFIFGEDACATFAYPIDDDFETRPDVVTINEEMVARSTVGDSNFVHAWILVVAACVVVGGLALLAMRKAAQRASYQRIGTRA